MTKARILIVDDEESTREVFAELLQRWDYEVDQTADGHGALKLAAETRPDVIISDLVMPKLDGLALVRALREEQPDTPVVIITGKGTIDAAVEAVREGVFDFVEKPLDPARLKVILQRALEKKETLHEMHVLRRRLGQVDAGVGLIGNSPPMRKAMELVEKVAPSKASVVITGQSGTGKEMVARAIHQLSPRRDKPFIAINCSAIPATLIESEMFGHERGAFTGAAERRIGCFELADAGTLLLDEIGEMPAPTQAKLLRVLEDRKVRRLGSKSETPVDVRVLAATNKEPEQAVSNGQLRQDLYFRLNVFHINLPPLREHKDDIPLLVEHILRDVNAKHGKHVRGIGAEVLDIFMGHTWPGNIRELRNVLERATIMCEKDLITRASLPGEFGRTVAKGPSDLSAIKFPVGTTVDAMERVLILQTLGATGNNKTRAAELLGISLKTLHNKLKEYGGDRAETE